MSKAKDLTGSRVGKLLLLERKRENNKTFYYCRCDCGNEKWIRADALTKEKPTLSCGCLSKETQFKGKDIRDKVFGRLKAIKPTTDRDRNNGSVIWECKCNCGNVAYISETDLSSGVVVSCGCYRKEIQQLRGKKIGKLHIDKHIVEDTNLQVISTSKPMRHNTSGYKGVIWDSNRNKWKAEIYFKKKCYFLGRYNKKEDAIKVRKEAEEKLHKAFIKDLEGKI